MRDRPNLDQLVSYRDFLAAAETVLEPAAFDYYRSGALTEWTLRENERAFTRWRFHRRVMVDVSRLDVTATILGCELAMPVLVAPTAFHRLADPDGELATARAAATSGTVMVNSTLSTQPLEAVAAAGGDVWFQLYILRDRGRTVALVERAVAAGCRAIVLTVDAPTIGIRYADQRNRFQLPDGLTMATLADDFPDDGTGSGLRAFSAQFDQSLTWRDLEWLCSLSDLPVVVKGVLTGVDARRAIEAGAAAVAVSNHGGRQLDGDPATLDALPEVADEVGDETTVLLDGGVRTGPDVVKALALGASAVLVGRPVLWGLAAGGQQGVEKVLGLLRDEVADTLRQAGLANLEAVHARGADLLRPC